MLYSIVLRYWLHSAITRSIDAMNRFLYVEEQFLCHFNTNCSPNIRRSERIKPTHVSLPAGSFSCLARERHAGVSSAGPVPSVSRWIERLYTSLPNRQAKPCSLYPQTRDHQQNLSIITGISASGGFRRQLYERKWMLLDSLPPARSAPTDTLLVEPSPDPLAPSCFPSHQSWHPLLRR